MYVPDNSFTDNFSFTNANTYTEQYVSRVVVPTGGLATIKFAIRGDSARDVIVKCISTLGDYENTMRVSINSFFDVESRFQGLVRNRGYYISVLPTASGQTFDGTIKVF